MRKAEKTDISLVVDILSSSFLENPSVNWVIKNDNKIEKRIQVLCRYSFLTTLIRNGVYISSNEKGVALCYKYNEKNETLSDYRNQLVLAIMAIGLRRVPGVLRREAYIKKYRPKDGNYLYFWFFGVKRGHQNGESAKELKNNILSYADKKGLAIYLETSVEKNKRVYERYGFEVYHIWIDHEKNVELYFMRRTPKL